jgi:hypothetical protein
MSLLRIGAHSLVLVIADLAGIAGGALTAFHILGVANQVGLQLPVAILLTVGFFCAWIFFLRVLGLTRLSCASPKECWASWGISILWAPLLFIPLHYFTQGYVTGSGNLIALALYQVPVNILALVAASTLQAPEANANLQRDTQADRILPSH